MASSEKIEYIEISVYDGITETTGLLTHYGPRSSRLRLLTDTDNTYELFQLKYFTITRIIVGKSDLEFDIEDQYIFKMDEDDQEIAITVLLNHLKRLEVEGKTNGTGFVNKDAFINPPDKYLKSKINTSNFTSTKTTITVGGTTVADTDKDKKITTPTTTTTGNDKVYNYNNVYNDNYAKRNKKTVIFLSRSSALPSKAFLSKMKAKVAEITAKKFKGPLPYLVGDTESKDVPQDFIDNPIEDYCDQGFGDFGHGHGQYNHREY